MGQAGSTPSSPAGSSPPRAEGTGLGEAETVPASPKTTLRRERRRKEKKPSRAGSTLLRLRASAGGGEEAGGRRVEALFERYRAVPEEPDEADELELAETDAVGPNGMAALLADLGLAEDDVVAFVVAWKLGCQRASRITRAEFRSGLAALQCDSLESLRALLPKLEGQLKAHQRDVFAYAFQISRPPNSKILDLASARILLELFLPPQRYPLTAPFVEWLTSEHQTGYRALNYDQYINFFDFSHSGMADDLSNYDADEGCWPSIIDEFVEYFVQQARGKADGA